MNRVMHTLWAGMLVVSALAAAGTAERTWTADNGNGTFSNPLFYDEFSDPDLIRVGNDYYMTGTTMHAMPGLPVLHSRDLVNWRLLSYAAPRLDFGPEYRWRTVRRSMGKGSGHRASATATARSISSTTCGGSHPRCSGPGTRGAPGPARP